MSIQLYSSLTKKYIMSLAGLFLLTFLLVHLSINLLVLVDDDRSLFNTVAHFMGTNVFIQTFQWVLFGGFIIHIIFGFILQIKNWMARPKRYNKKAISETSFFSKFMIHTGIIILVFLVIHMGDFFVKKIGGVVPEIHAGDMAGMEDMGILVVEKFKMGSYVLFYVLSLLFLGFHLDHAFQSSFQSLGLSHDKYTPFIKGLSRFLAIVITIGYITIPLCIYFYK